MFSQNAIGFWSQTAPSYDADVLTYISGLTTALSDDILGKINTFVAGYKSDDGLTNLSDAYDVMYYLANETAESSLRNLVKRAHDAVAVNSPTFTPYEGWKGDGISSYIDTNYNPATEGVKYTASNASFGIYIRNWGNILNDYTCHLDNSAYMRLSNWTGTNIGYAINTQRQLVADLRVAGFFIASKKDNSTQGLYLNKELKNNTNNIDYAVQSNNVVLFKRITNNFYQTGQQSFVFIGNGKTQTNVNNITDYFEALMDSNSKGIIA